ncbi:hypothetical protein Cylst_6395 (plasmid) [Cylindrospermum stagnale PCC 7417]|uniref:Uncharacterized protein n=1 Tax=Cylindrospermum stagnale PCC 7417 TaxID=56107 RepID=K9X830_9NOST|nr:hypothetical protein [Cylindrospermum stagnale]AFZ28613.1 hypothetical protein Cylst_6395 [Cylindrospermum stagnale PCC 7417]
MTTTPGHNNGQPPNRLDRIEAILERVVIQQETSGERLAELTYKVDDFISTANTVLARSAILDDIIVRLDRNFDEMQRKSEEHQQRFEENQRSTNAALERLEAILIKLMDK